MLTELFKAREKPAAFSKRAAKVWLKRVYHLRALIALRIRSARLRILGAKIASTALVEKIDARGEFKNLTVGAFSFIGKETEISLHALITIGKCVVINSRCSILTASHSLSDNGWPLVKRPIVIHDYVWIATKSIILPGVTIGQGAVIGAGAVIREDVPPFALVIGNPQKIVSYRKAQDLHYFPAANSSPFEAWLGKYRADN